MTQGCSSARTLKETVGSWWWAPAWLRALTRALTRWYRPTAPASAWWRRRPTPFRRQRSCQPRVEQLEDRTIAGTVLTGIAILPVPSDLVSQAVGNLDVAANFSPEATSASPA